MAELAGEMGYPATREEMVARVERLGGDPLKVAYVAEDDDGTVVGWVEARRRDLLLSEGSAEIVGLVVAADTRGRGWGRQLIETVATWARDHGCHRLRIRTNIRREEARVIYAHLGFHETKQQVVFDRDLTAWNLAASRLVVHGAVCAGRMPCIERS